MEERSAQEDLAMIRRLMEQGRATVAAGAPHYVIWGLLLTAALVAQWAAATGRLGLASDWIWGVALGAGWLGSMVAGYRSSREARVRSAGGRTLAGIWAGTGVMLTLVAVAGLGTGAVSGHAMLGITAAALGTATFATSFVQGSGAVRAAAVLWWIGAAVLFVWQDPAALLVEAGLMAALVLAPGLRMLTRRDAASSAAVAGGGTGR